ncbi:MAG: FMN-binding protein [Bacteriovoracia bacterium]
MEQGQWQILGVGLAGLGSLGLAVPFVAHAEVYLSADDAAKLLLPNLKLARRELELTPEQVEKIEAASGENVRNRKLTAYVGPKKEVVFVDQVIGKHEFITFAVGLGADGAVRGVEILEYRETYGGQVRHADWRQQFVGKNSQAKLKVESDIKNISGATLSSVHVTGGVRRLIHTYEAVRASL